MLVYFIITGDEYIETSSLFKFKSPDFAYKYNQNYNFAYAAYQIGEDSNLLRGNLPLQTRGGLILIRDRDAPFINQPDILSLSILRECGRRGCTGVILDFENPPRDDLYALINQLSRQLYNSGKKLYIPYAYANPAPDNAIIFINTAISGGNFREYLSEQINQIAQIQEINPINQKFNQDLNHKSNHAKNPEKYSFALDIQRLRVDFQLPAPSGDGRNLNPDEFKNLSDGKAVFFSPDLCARYFTFTERNPDKTNAAHFVLFDDADTINIKLKIGAELGFNAAFLLWSEIRDFVQDLRW